jgi:CRISPR-associated protein Csm4
LHSDTLYGLLLVATKYVLGDTEFFSLLNSFKEGNPPFRISSAFPYLYNELGSKTLLLPKPNSVAEMSEKDDDYEKKYKNLQYLPLSSIEKLINAEISEQKLKEVFFEFIDEYELLTNHVGNTKAFVQEVNSNSELNSRFGLDLASIVTLVSDIELKTDFLKTSIDRLTNVTKEVDSQGQLHYSFEYFITNGGLYFLYSGKIEIIEAALNYLAHFGFGADNATGKGHFDLEYHSIEINQANNDTDSIYTLSLYSPTTSELEFYLKKSDKMYYEIFSKQGVIGNQFKDSGNLYKKTVNYFKEGALLPNPKHTTLGRCNTVATNREFDVIQIGMPLFLYANI